MMDITIKTKLCTFYNAKFRVVMRYVGSGIKGVELIVESGIRMMGSGIWDHSPARDQRYMYIAFECNSLVNLSIA